MCAVRMYAVSACVCVCVPMGNRGAMRYLVCANITHDVIASAHARAHTFTRNHNNNNNDYMVGGGGGVRRL